MIGTHFNDSSFSIAKCVVVNNSYLDIQSLDLQYTNGPALLVHNNSRAYILEVDFYGAAAASGVALTVLDDSKAKLVGGEVTDADIAYGAFSNSQVLVSASNAPTFAGTVTTQYSPAKSAADVTPTWGNANAWIADDA